MLTMGVSMLQKVRTDVDTTLKQFFDENKALAEPIDKNYLDLWGAIAKLSKTGGKRLRPYMVMVAYQGYGGHNYEAMIPVAAAQELLHLGLTIHDDIIDRDFMRYGIKNVSGLYYDRYKTMIPDDEERAHYARSTAILAGDMVLSGAYQMVVGSGVTDAQKTVAQRYLGKAMFNVAAGELLDTESPHVPMGSHDPIKIANFKTATYSFVAPLLTGAAVAGADVANMTKLEEYGRNLGIAYQLRDDVLGMFGDVELTGKSNKGDIREGKPTYMMQAAFRMAGEGTEVLQALVGKSDITEKETQQVRAIVENCGAKAAAEQLIEEYASKAVAALEHLTISAEMYMALEELVHTATRRVR
jgi:geranylgeranyl diphosphate synthase type II